VDIEKYLLAKANGLAERFRGDEISRRIAVKYPLSAQIALLMDKDHKATEWEAYQAFRAKVKQDVDAAINEMEASLNENTET
jgi:hypothetical protein